MVDILFLGDALGGAGKDGKIGIAGAPGLIDALKIITGREKIKDEEDKDYFAEITVDFIPLWF